MSTKKEMTPEDLIKQIEAQNLRVSPIVELQIDNQDEILVACDCSGCNNPAVFEPNGYWGE